MRANIANETFLFAFFSKNFSFFAFFERLFTMQKSSRRGSMRGSELSIFIHDAGAATAIPQEMQEVAALALFD